MPSDAVALALIVGACNWAFRYLPLRAGLHDVAPGGAFGRFLTATGPAAIATLFVAEALPYLEGAALPLPLICGVAAVLVVFGLGKSVVLATLAGSLAFGVATALAAGP